MDTTFNIGFYPGKIVVQADGKFITVGAKVARFNPDGSLDSGFIQGPAANKVAMQSDGRLVVSGSFTSYNGTAQNGIARISTGDTDNDGLEDGTDTDTDNDGHLNGADAFVWNAAEWLDTDHDGVGNNADTDDDGDRVPDVLDADPLNPLVDAMPLNGAYKGSALRAAQAAQ